MNRSSIVKAIAIWGFVIAVPFACFGQKSAWVLPNFSDRLDVNVLNTADAPVHTVAVVSVGGDVRVAKDFPGKTAIAVMQEPLSFLPTQVDDLDGDGRADEVAFVIDLPAHAKKTVSIYFSNTLERSIPWPQKVSASHSFGYNRATAALESERIGFRTYGGFFLDVQARAENHPGLFNELVGLKSPSISSNLPVGRDVLHIGETLGLGGVFLRAGEAIYRPPVNVPDYMHKPEAENAPKYRVVANGPVRAVIEARIDDWRIGNDAVKVRALYSINADSEVATCHLEIVPLHVTRAYEVGAGVLHIAAGRAHSEAGSIVVTGEQSRSIGRIGLAAFYSTDDAHPVPEIKTGEGANEAFVFHRKLVAGTAFSGEYRLTAAWSGSGIANLEDHLAGTGQDAMRTVEVRDLEWHRTPAPDRIEGEPR